MFQKPGKPGHLIISSVGGGGKEGNPSRSVK